MFDLTHILPIDLRAFGGGDGADCGTGGAGDSAPGAAEGGRESLPLEGKVPRPEAVTDEVDSNTAACAAAPHQTASPQGEALRVVAPCEAPDAAPDPAGAYRRAASAFAEARCRAWLDEAADLAARDPDFDLAALARDRVFTLLLRGGVPMARAYAAAASERLARRAAAEARRAYAAGVRARGSRIPEAGLTPAPALAVREDAVEKLSDAEVRGILARIAGRERISFG